MMNIALIHYRVGETDGVSLEMNKWKIALEEQGHNVFFIAGNKGCTEAFIIPELSLDNEEMKKIHYNSYYELKDYSSEKELELAINKHTGLIEKKLLDLIDKYKIEVFIPNNILSLGHHLSAALAICNIAVRRNIKLICHHHDFYWERVVFNHPTCELVKNILKRCFPLRFSNVSHCVINSIAQNTLKQKKDLESVIVPNIFDFEKPVWRCDEYNSDLRHRLGIKENDLFFLQATRVTDRKAIELAIDFLSRIDEKRFRIKLEGIDLYNGKTFTEISEIYLVLPGLSGEKESATGYKEKLVKYAAENSVNLIWCNEILAETRKIEEQKYYSLWDFYANCDFITYPSIQEGWGNQLLEGLFAKKPMLVFEYPVFITDIRKCGIEYVSLGKEYSVKKNGLVQVDNEVIDKAVEHCIEILTDKEKYDYIADKNFNIGNMNFSMNTLKEKLNNIVKDK